MSNALSVLALPEGATILHRYRTTGAYYHVHPDLRQAIHGNGKGKGRPKRVKRERDWLVRLGARAETVLICFVDRYDPSGYVYHPQRVGRLVDAWERDERMYFRFRLLDFVAARQGKAAELSNKLKEALVGKKPPALVKGNPEAKDDGHYAILGPEIESWTDLVRGEAAWAATVRELSKTKKLGSSAGQRVVFLRTELRRLASDSRPEVPATIGGADRVAISKDAIYELRLSYQCPGQLVGSPVVAGVRIEHGDNLQVLGAREIAIDGDADDVSIPIATKRYTDDRHSVLRLDIVPSKPSLAAEENPKERLDVIGPKVNLLITLREGRFFWPAVLGSVLVFAVGSIVASSAPVTPLRIVAALGQAFALLMLFRLIGKKPV